MLVTGLIQLVVVILAPVALLVVAARAGGERPSQLVAASLAGSLSALSAGTSARIEAHQLPHSENGPISLALVAVGGGASSSAWGHSCGRPS
jgi:hypothetical protein